MSFSPVNPPVHRLREVAARPAAWTRSEALQNNPCRQPAPVAISLSGTWRTIAEVEAHAHRLARVVVEIGFTTVGCATLRSCITRTYWAMRALTALPPIAARPVARAVAADAGGLNSLNRKTKSHHHRYLNKPHYKSSSYHVAPPVDDFFPRRHRSCTKLDWS